MSARFKVLITGGRDWSDEAAVRKELAALPAGSILVHGACPRGADAIADSIARDIGFEIRRYPADWNRHGRAAGMIRNGDMIKAEHPDADGCNIQVAFAFPTVSSRGTWDCVRKLRKAGVRVFIISEDGRRYEQP